MSPEWQRRLAAARRVMAGALRLAGALLLAILSFWARLGGGARLALALGTLVAFAAAATPVAPGLSAIAQGLAVLLLASFGIWLIATSPFRR